MDIDELIDNFVMICFPSIEKSNDLDGQLEILKSGVLKPFPKGERFSKICKFSNVISFKWMSI